VVSVVLETTKQIEAMLVMHNYDRFLINSNSINKGESMKIILIGIQGAGNPPKAT
jgi:hypothetical protein